MQKPHPPPGQARPRPPIRNIFFVFLSQIWDMVATLGGAIILQKYYLSPGEFGHYAVSFSVVTLVVMLSFMGLQEIGVRELAANPDPRERGICLGNLLITRLVLLAVAGLVLALVLGLMGFDREIVLGSAMFFAALVIGSSAEMMMSAFMAAERFEFNLYQLFIERLVFLLGIVMVWRFDLGYYHIFSAIILSKLVKVILASAYLRRHLFVVIFQPSLAWITRTLKESCLIGLGISFGMGLSYLINIILERGTCVAQVGFFFAFLAPIIRAQMLAGSVSQGLMPRIARAAQADSPDFIKLVRGGAAFLFFLGCLGTLVGWTCRAWLVGFFCHPEAMVYLPAFGYLTFLLPTLFLDNILNSAFISRKLAREFFLSKLAGLLSGAIVAFVMVDESGLYAGVAGFVVGKWISTLIMLILFFIHSRQWGKGFTGLAATAPPLTPDGTAL